MDVESATGPGSLATIPHRNLWPPEGATAVEEEREVVPARLGVRP